MDGVYLELTFYVIEVIQGVDYSDYDDAAIRAFITVTADTMQGISNDDITVLSYGEEGSHNFATPDRARRLRSSRHNAEATTSRHLAVNTNLSVEIYYTVTAVAEEFGYSSSDYEGLITVLQEEITSGYLSDDINTDFTQEAVAEGAANIDAGTEVKFLTPRFGPYVNSSLLSPDEKDNGSSSKTSIVKKYQYFLLGGIGLIILLVVAVISCCCCYRKPADKNAIADNKESTDHEFDNVDFYSGDKSGQGDSQAAGKRNVMRFGFVPYQARASGGSMLSGSESFDDGAGDDGRYGFGAPSPRNE
jgi:hypothetical protein